MGLKAEERALLDGNNIHLNLGTPGQIDFRPIMKVMWRPSLIYIFTMITLAGFQRFDHAAVSVALCIIGDLILLAPPVVIFAVLMTGVITMAVALRKSRREEIKLIKSVIYWMYWPFWNFFLCIISIACAVVLANYLWDNMFHKHIELSRLQAYGNVDPAKTPGTRLQDSGIVEFANTVGMDRSKGGCFVNGKTYCVAPIMHGGQLLGSLGDMPSSGGYDYFAVGIDCCSCPNQDFRCGEWNNPIANGGLRSVDVKARPFYTMAVDDWSASYGKIPQHPLFFEYVSHPKYKVEMLWSRAAYFAGMSSFAAPIFFLCMAMVLSILYSYLVHAGAAEPDMVFEPPPWLATLWRLVLPDLHRLQQEKMIQQQMISAADQMTTGNNPNNPYGSA